MKTSINFLLAAILSMSVAIGAYAHSAYIADDEEPISMIMVEQKAQFPGGDAAMFKWIAENMKYPTQAIEEGIQGRIDVQFVVEKYGSVSNVKVVRGKHPALNAEAVRIVENMPKWTPGSMGGLTVRVTVVVPVNFKLK